MDSPYQQALDFIHSFIDFETELDRRSRIKYDLRRVEELLSRLDNPHLKAKTVHIAGTKGKGSVAAMIASTLTVAGYNTGLFTSPHLHNYNERMRVNGKSISDQELVSLVENIKPEVEAVNNKATYGRLTTFEITTALGFMHFASKGVDVQVIEVGLGGRLDATNVVLPEVCVITSISLDHMDVLGNTLSKIASEKAGIVKQGSIVVTSPLVDEANDVIEDVCLNLKAKLVRIGRDVSWHSFSIASNRQSFQVNGRLGSYQLSIPLLGQHQLDNATTALATLEVLVEKGFNITKDNIIVGLATVNWEGRIQILGYHPLVVVDGAHNTDSARKLKHALEQYFSFDRAILIIGVSADKNMAGIISELLPLFAKVVVTRSIHPRAMATAPIVAEVKKHGVEVQETDDISVALPLALDMAAKNDMICITGSLFIVAAAIEQAKALELTI